VPFGYYKDLRASFYRSLPSGYPQKGPENSLGFFRVFVASALIFVTLREYYKRHRAFCPGLSRKR